jgi:branched-chain amino acid transport system ATP-binding protein
MLKISELSAGYDGNDVIHDVSIHVDRGEAVSVIGSNGAGKSTLFRAICGLIPPSSGRVVFLDHDITRLPTHRIARLGLSFVPAERHLFPHMTVIEHLQLGAYPNRPDRATLGRVFDLFPRLAERRMQPAGTMSGGEQQMLAIGRALMSRPRILVLDEPSTGLAPKLAAETYQALGMMRGEGLTLLVSEQQVPLALKLADRGYVLENGVIQMEGTAKDLAANPEVRRAYLGVA